jgi:hypothetical protein
MEPDVVQVQALSPLTLQVTFADGTAGMVRFEESHLTGVFKRLSDPDVFQQVHIHGGAVAWPGDLDLAPDAMYQAFKTHGQWILR